MFFLCESVEEAGGGVNEFPAPSLGSPFLLFEGIFLIGCLRDSVSHLGLGFVGQMVLNSVLARLMFLGCSSVLLCCASAPLRYTAEDTVAVSSDSASYP